MNAAHFHLIVNHMPIVGIFWAIALTAYGQFKKNDTALYAGLISFVAVAVFAFLSSNSGEGAEEIVEGLQGVTHDIIHEHEEMGEKAMFACIALGVLSLAALFLAKYRRLLTWVILVGSIGAAVLLSLTGTTGGEIRHTEIRKDYVPAAPTGEEREEGEDH